MNAKEVLKAALSSTQQMLAWYVSDLADAELLERPVPAANHIAWQLGHLIHSEIYLVRSQLPDTAYPELPAGFAEQHAKEKAADESPQGFGKKDDYLGLFNQVRTATLAVVDQLAEADLDRPTQGTMARFAPRWGDLLIAVSNHTLMHASQFTVLRRKLGKPVLF